MNADSINTIVRIFNDNNITSKGNITINIYANTSRCSKAQRIIDDIRAHLDKIGRSELWLREFWQRESGELYPPLEACSYDELCILYSFATSFQRHDI
ncbi:hypothetical protein [Limisalsivibrio acetivorans]|uniref:hypothetical protein n=1 Tax=Limisalsivibrio acetivorans TaxID=1304888 RepID=UPI0003B527C0|nr:hypothetical protein [Limisalsivibrio acetivorans]